MISLCYVQIKDGEFLNETAFAFYNGCKHLGIPTVKFKAEDIENLNIQKDTVVHGYLGVVRKAFDILKVTQPNIDGFPPDEIYKFYGREIRKTTMKEVREALENNKKFFIKPLEDHKAFTGFVINDTVGGLVNIAKFEDEFKVMASEIVKFSAEYRLFVHNGLIIDCRFYLGDFTKIIDFEIAMSCVNSFKHSPIAYSLDMGLTENGRTLVVEINDAFALGNYGMPSSLYAQMVIDRWEEIVK